MPVEAVPGAGARGGGAVAGARAHAVGRRASALPLPRRWLSSSSSVVRPRPLPLPSPSSLRDRARRGSRDDVSAWCCSIVPLRRRARCLQVQVLLERQPRWAPSPRTFWIETSARKISFVRARCSNAGQSGGAERARQVVMGDGKHLPTGYQPALLGLRSPSLTRKQRHFAAAAGFAPLRLPRSGSRCRPA